MRKIFLAALSITLIGLAGYLSFLVGAILSAMDFSKLLENYVLFIAALLSVFMGSFFLVRIFQLRMTGLLPLTPFIFICLALGFFYDRIYIPEGFKIIGVAILLMLTGLAGARRIVKSRKDGKVGL